MTPDEKKMAIAELDHLLLDALEDYIKAVRAKRNTKFIDVILREIDQIKWQILKIHTYK
jgi:hypothetical protein